MIETISILFIVIGLLFFLSSVVGILRLPDFYSRMHAAGKGDTLSTILIVSGIAIYYMDLHAWSFASVLVALKLLAIIVFVFIASPTSTHVLMQAGLDSGIDPVTGEKKENKKGEDAS